MAGPRIEIRTCREPPRVADKKVVGEAEERLDDAIERAQAGDPRGFDVLFRALGASVAGYLRARGVSDPDGIANEVFLRAFRTIHTFRGDADRFRSWIFTIAHHAAVDDTRRRRRRVSEAPLDRAPEAAGGDVETEVLAQLAHERIQTLLSGLSADQRDVLMLRIVADRSISETAAVLGKSHEAVKALQHRGLAALHRALSSDDAVSR
jgi:RNA polymerase sigma-70 factor, ECF subfamily